MVRCHSFEWDPAPQTTVGFISKSSWVRVGISGYDRSSFHVPFTRDTICWCVFHAPQNNVGSKIRNNWVRFGTTRDHFYDLSHPSMFVQISCFALSWDLNLQNVSNDVYRYAKERCMVVQVSLRFGAAGWRRAHASLRIVLFGRYDP